MKKQLNETDLHIQFKLDTGLKHSHNFTSYGKDTQYIKEYQTWLETNLLKLMNEPNKEELIGKINSLEKENSELAEDIYDLEYEMQTLETED